MEQKTPKGTRDFDPFLEGHRRRLVGVCENVCRLFGAQPIQTPVFEVKSLMMEKYNGETDKQVYEIHEGDTIISKIKDLKTSQDSDNSLFKDLNVNIESAKTTITQATDQIYKCVDDFERSEQYVLRFDLTVPFSRFVKGSDCNKLIRFQVGTVYRKDQPNMKNGRFREFLQLGKSLIFRS